MGGFTAIASRKELEINRFQYVTSVYTMVTYVHAYVTVVSTSITGGFLAFTGGFAAIASSKEIEINRFNNHTKHYSFILKMFKNMTIENAYIKIDKKTKVNISAFAKGIYILKLNSDKETLVKKFAKE